MNDVEKLFNRLTDDDAGWWPFLFLRPDPSERMSEARVLLIAALYGVFVGLLANIAARFTPQGSEMNPLVFPAGTTFAFFVFYRFTFALFWNRRAVRVAAAQARQGQWGRGLPSQEED